MQIFTFIWITLWCIAGAVGGAILLGGFTSIPMSILGAIIGLPVGFLLGKYMKISDWLTHIG
ncbi:MAG: hypothetical protein CMJ39_02300 [Phycisphaerae bacterium]|nr:hypothetical protein [Phycisphaerae bacterium]